MKKYLFIIAAGAMLASCNNSNNTKQATSIADSTATTKTDGPALEHIKLNGENLLPESAAIDPANGDLYVGSIGNGSIQKISGGSNTWFHGADTGANRKAISGMAVDAGRKRIWVLNIDVMNPMSGATGIRVFDLANGKELKAFSLPKDKAPHGLNDIALDAAGNAYISDCFSPILWKVDSSMASLQPYITDAAFTLDPKAFNLNGLAFTPDGKYLIAAVANASGPQVNGGDGYLFRIELATKKVQKVNSKGYEGGDGIAFGPDGALYTTTMMGGVAKVDFNNEYLDATATHPAAAEVTALKPFAPSALRIYSDRAYVVGSQLDHTFPNSPTYQKPFAPFEVTAIPLAALK